MAYRMGMNANNNPGARVPRNALRVWMSNSTVERWTRPGARFGADLLTCSLRTCLPADSNAIHPADWPDAKEPRQTNGSL